MCNDDYQVFVDEQLSNPNAKGRDHHSIKNSMLLPITSLLQM
jgi:hypothetical protein